MKHAFILTISLMLLSVISVAQSVPQGMKYQAVARDLKGQIIANRSLQLKITLYSDTELRLTQYTEIHKITTNELGLFSLSIGQGFAQQGTFDKVPWSEADIWMEVAIQADDDVEFITISDSRMLSVPYAFHAATASQIVGAAGDRGLGTGNTGGVPAQVWVLAGNSGTDPVRDKLGTTDMKDLVIVTNNLERMRIDAHGDVNVMNNLNVNENLYVNHNVQLNGEGGETINKGDFTVDDGSDTYLTGELTVDDDTRLNAKLIVEGSANLNSTLKVIDDTWLGADLNVLGNTMLESSLDVDGPTNLNSTLDVDGITHILNATQSTTKDNGALIVEGGVGIEKDLNVGGTANFGGATTFGNTVEITTSTADAVLEITNMNGSSGDGIVIRLGKTHPAWDGDDYLNVTNPIPEIFDNAINTVEGWIDGEAFEASDLLDFWPNAYIAGFMCNITNVITGAINDAVGLPADVGPYHIWDRTVIFGGIEEIGIPELAIPALTIPKLFTFPAIPEVDCSGMPSFSMPNISFTDVDNSLDNENQFLSFQDKDGRELGSIRAESVSDWRARFFSADYFVDLMGEVVGIDIISGIAGAVNKFTEIASSHNEMGVEYASGHGDYAEWLERVDNTEKIAAGDIVGVIAGKITKDLSKAEQVMAVSTKPIMLGNTPAKNMEANGNKIAFMGQIPVKVIGAVAAGDYIVGNPATPGYGIAVHPADMTPGYAQLVVGRSWETKLKEGPKMVNTVIGVDNGHFLQIMQQYQQQITSFDQRMGSIEAALQTMQGSAQPVAVNQARSNSPKRSKP